MSERGTPRFPAPQPVPTPPISACNLQPDTHPAPRFNTDGLRPVPRSTYPGQIIVYGPREARPGASFPPFSMPAELIRAWFGIFPSEHRHAPL